MAPKARKDKQTHASSNRAPESEDETQNMQDRVIDNKFATEDCYIAYRDRLGGARLLLSFASIEEMNEFVNKEKDNLADEIWRTRRSKQQTASQCNFEVIKMPNPSHLISNMATRPLQHQQGEKDCVQKQQDADWLTLSLGSSSWTESEADEDQGLYLELKL